VKAVAALLALALAGCKLATLRDNEQDAAREGAIVGKVAHQEADFSRIVAFGRARGVRLQGRPPRHPARSRGDPPWQAILDRAASHP
jgi:hypothetical protein